MESLRQWCLRSTLNIQKRTRILHRILGLSSHCYLKKNIAQNRFHSLQFQTRTDTANKLLDEFYLGCLQSLGSLSREHHILADTALQPVIQPPRRVPLALQPKFKNKLEVWLKVESLKKDEPTEWLKNWLANCWTERWVTENMFKPKRSERSSKERTLFSYNLWRYLTHAPWPNLLILLWFCPATLTILGCLRYHQRRYHRCHHYHWRHLHHCSHRYHQRHHYLQRLCYLRYHRCLRYLQRHLYHRCHMQSINTEETLEERERILFCGRWQTFWAGKRRQSRVDVYLSDLQSILNSDLYFSDLQSTATLDNFNYSGPQEMCPF